MAPTRLVSPSPLWRRSIIYVTAATLPAGLTALIRALPEAWPKPYSWQYLGLTIAVALVGGMGPGALALLVSFVAVLWLQIPTPVHPGVEMFGAIGLVLLLIVSRFRSTQTQLRERAAVLHSIIEAMPDAVYVVNRDGISLCNTNALRMLGARSLDDLQASAGDLSERLAIRWPDSGQRLTQDELPFERALRGETVVEEVLATNVASGAELYVRCACAPIVEANTILGAVVVTSDITERKRAEQSLEAARELAERESAAAQQANQAKDHFLAVLSHELRTPLTPVLAGIALLNRDASLSPRSREYVEILKRNVEMEARLIDDLLDVTRITHGKVQLNKRPLELHAILNRAIEVCRPDIEARRVHFGVDYQLADPCLIDADDARLQQVFWNLLKNAIKFTPKEGCVGIRARDDGPEVVVEISDSRIGIADADVTRIFDAFAQAERTLSRQFGGLGLGLTISRALVEKHGGTLTARSEGAGKGATFIVRLPRAAVERPPVVNLSDHRRRPRAGRSLRVLLVEDHGDTAQMMTAMLLRDGHRVETAGDVASALDMATRSSFDVVVSDIGLPDQSGIELLRELRSRGNDTPAIAVSGYGHEHDVRQTMAAGFSVHLVKPVDLGQLLQAIDGVTASS